MKLPWRQEQTPTRSGITNVPWSPRCPPHFPSLPFPLPYPCSSSSRTTPPRTYQEGENRLRTARYQAQGQLLQCPLHPLHFHPPLIYWRLHPQLPQWQKLYLFLLQWPHQMQQLPVVFSVNSVITLPTLNTGLMFIRVTNIRTPKTLRSSVVNPTITHWIISFLVKRGRTTLQPATISWTTLLLRKLISLNQTAVNAEKLNLYTIHVLGR